MRLLPKGFTDGLSRVTGDFLKGVWKGMGPDPSRRGRRVKTPKKRGTVPRDEIRRVVKKNPPER